MQPVDGRIYSLFEFDDDTFIDEEGNNGQNNSVGPIGTGVCGRAWLMMEDEFLRLKGSHGAPTGLADFSLSLYTNPLVYSDGSNTYGRTLLAIGGTEEGPGPPGEFGAWLHCNRNGELEVHTTRSQRSSKVVLTLGTWTHILLTYSASDRMFRMYQDCKVIFAAAVVMDLHKDSPNGGMAMGVHYTGSGKDGVSGAYMVDHVVFADHVATCNEVRAGCTPVYAVCGSDSYSCPAGFVKKADADMILCGASVSQCRVSNCCDCTCTKSYSCPAGSAFTPAAVTTPCLGLCTADLCCEARCRDVMCPGGSVPDPLRSGNVCGSTPGGCSDDDCCLATCALHDCSVGWLVRPPASSSICGKASPMTDGCSDNMCCDATCGTYTCGAGLFKVSSSISFLCGGGAGPCTEELCCRQKCETYGCTAGMSPTGSPDTVCAGSACTDAECCEATCRLHDCPALHPGYANNLSVPILCGGPVSSCTKDMCCVETCDTHTCQQGHRLKSTSGMIECSTGPCDDALCCDAYCDYGMFGCDANYIPKNASDAIRCGDTAVSCTNGLCCDATCGTHTCTPSVGWGTLPAAAGNRCNGDCTSELCCAVTCGHPDFSCPLGTAPLSEVENVTCGATVQSCNHTACCLETPVADTLAPSPQPAPLSEQVQPVSDTGMAAVALTGAAVAGGFSAGAAMRLALAASPCREAIPRSVNPAGVEVDGSDAVGADLVSMGITAGFALLCLGVLKLVSLKGRVLCPRIFSEVDTQGLLRLPAVPLLLFQFFFQGMTLAGMNLVLHGDKVWHSTVGAAVVLLCLAVPVLTMRTVLRSVGVEAAYAVAVGRTNTPVLFLIGPGEWVNLTHKTMWVERYSTVIRTFRQGRTWFLLLEYAASFALSAVKATQPLSLAGCGHVKLASGFIFAALLLLEAAYWPHARSRDSACDTTMLGLQAAAMALLAAGYYTEDLDHWGFSAAAVLLLAAMCLLLLKAVLDVAATVYLLCTDRRELLQEDILAQRDAASQSLLSLTLLTNTDPSVSFSSPAVSPASGTSDTLLGSTWHRAPAAVLTTEPPRHLLKDNTPHEPGSLIRGLLGPAAATAANEPLLGKTKDESQDPITICSAWRSVPRAAVTEDHPAVDPLHHTPDSDTGRLADCLKDGAEFADPLESCLLSSFKGPRASFDSRSYGDPDPQSPDSFGLPLVRIVSSCRGFPRQAPTTPYTLGSSATSVSSHRPSVCL